ncbi:MAG: hypothetical protein WAO69_02825 [Aestuariivita sp.]|uniref:hypothetical protein n=1 Tax=Aestuariivita sp. TaxID=1872407 RepID=UPI003BAFC6CA
MTVRGKEAVEGRATRPAPRSMKARYAKSEHEKAAKVLGYALTLDTPDAWYAASAVWQARMTPQEAAAKAWAALHATEPELALMVARAALGCAGVPLPTLDDIVADAGWWADLAGPEERAAYAVACFNRFSPVEREEFREFVRGQE